MCPWTNLIWIISPTRWFSIMESGDLKPAHIWKAVMASSRSLHLRTPHQKVSLPTLRKREPRVPPLLSKDKRPNSDARLLSQFPFTAWSDLLNKISTSWHLIWNGFNNTTYLQSATAGKMNFNTQKSQNSLQTEHASSQKSTNRTFQSTVAFLIWPHLSSFPFPKCLRDEGSPVTSFPALTMLGSESQALPGLWFGTVESTFLWHFATVHNYWSWFLGTIWLHIRCFQTQFCLNKGSQLRNLDTEE